MNTQVCHLPQELTASWKMSLQCQYTLCCDSSMAFLKIGFDKLDCACCSYSSARTLAASNFTSSNAFITWESSHCRTIGIASMLAIQSCTPKKNVFKTLECGMKILTKTTPQHVILHLYDSIHYDQQKWKCMSNIIPLVPNEFSPNRHSWYGSAKYSPTADVSELQL